MGERVAIGMSGGVDSSVAALILKNRECEPIGLFMNNWNDATDGRCSAESDSADAKRVCAKLDIPFYSLNFSKEYFDEVFRLFVDEYEKGRTPNPDVLCNRAIKFGIFLDFARKLGATRIATGHYCGIKEDGGRAYLVRARNEEKDQTYFLNQLTEKQLKNVIFPLADVPDKAAVREMARKNGLITAEKKDSTGICFIGERKFRDFLKKYIPMRKGEVRTLDGTIIGEHDGAFYYTIGQRKGFGLGGMRGEANAKPWYVIRKDVADNALYVAQGEVPELYSTELIAENFNFINDPIESGAALARIRHRQPLQRAEFRLLGDGSVRVTFEKPQRAITPGQYCVLYSGRVCLGGGAIR